METQIKFISKSEWFEFEKPLAEPDALWIEGEPYKIERREDDKTVTWYGRLTNWVKGVNEWTMLTKNGFIPCKPPIYEVLYQEWLRNQNNPKHGAWLYEQALAEARENNLGEE